MIARIFTYLFYAVVFFALGVWAAPTVGRVGDLFDDGLSVVSTSADDLWRWAESTIATPAAWNAKPTSTPAASTAKPVVATAPAAPVPAAPAPAPAAPKAVAAATAPAPAPAAPVTPAAPAKAAAPAPAPVASDPVDRARAAWSRGDVSGAIRAYEEAIAARPDDIPLNGELGNVYWTSGRLADAARVYHRAALAMIAAGRGADATQLVDPIRKGDAGLADDLAARLAAKP